MLFEGLGRAIPAPFTKTGSHPARVCPKRPQYRSAASAIRQGEYASGNYAILAWTSKPVFTIMPSKPQQRSEKKLTEMRK
jgi:hypothetical protein